MMILLVSLRFLIKVEFLYTCVQQTAEKTIPAEVDYLYKYDEFKVYLEDYFEMPDKTIAQLVRFLEQGKGKLSRRTKEKEFKALKASEVKSIEVKYTEVINRPIV